MRKAILAGLILLVATSASAVEWRAHWKHSVADYALTTTYVASIEGLGDFDLGKPPQAADTSMRTTVTLPVGTLGPLNATVRAFGNQITTDPSDVKILTVSEPPQWAGAAIAVVAVVITWIARRGR